MITANDTVCSPVLTLSECLDKYLLIRGVDRKKYYPRYLVIAEKIWEELFQKTLFVVKSVWIPLKKGEPYNYIEKPKDCLRWFSVNDTDKCGLLQPLFVNQQLNVITKPTTKKCGCTCDCGGLCEDINSTTLTTKAVFTVNGITYYEKTWIRLCPNGDILEYRELPTKKFNDYTGDGGDFNEDYNNDYDIAANPLANYEIVTETIQRKICAISVKPCGCPEQTAENEALLNEFCGCFLPVHSRCRKKHCDQFVQNVNNNHKGEIKESECGTKIYFKPSVRFRSCGTELQKIPDYLQLQYQTSGKSVGQEALIPIYAELAMWAGTDWLSKQYNGKYGVGEKQAAYINFTKEVNDVILMLNPISLEYVYNQQDLAQKW